jgi:hypothetical protein
MSLSFTLFYPIRFMLGENAVCIHLAGKLYKLQRTPLGAADLGL